MPKVKFNNLGPLTDAQRALVEEHVEWAVSGARKYHRLSGQLLALDELSSAAYYGLILAAQRFDPTRGLSFKTYAMPWTESHLSRAFGDIRKANGGRYRNDGRIAPVLRRVPWPTDEDGHQIDAFAAESTDPLSARELAQQRALVLSTATNDREREILRGRLNGESYASIGRRLGVTGKYIQAIWPRIIDRATVRVRSQMRRQLRPEAAA